MLDLTDIVIEPTDDFAQTGLRVVSALRLHCRMTLSIRIIRRKLGTLPETLQQRTQEGIGSCLIYDTKEPDIAIVHGRDGEPSQRSTRHHAVTKSGWKWAFNKETIDSLGCPNPCKSAISAYSVDGIDGSSWVFKSNGRRATSAVGSIPTYSRHPLRSKAFWAWDRRLFRERPQYMPKTGNSSPRESLD